jgi:hypothetical protein
LKKTAGLPGETKKPGFPGKKGITWLYFFKTNSTDSINFKRGE